MRYRLNQTLATAGIAMLVSGCAVGPDFKSPPAPAASGYTERPLPAQTVAARGEAQKFSSDEKIPAQWWTLFRSEKLDQLVKAALAGSPSVEAAKATLNQARETLTSQTGYEFPQVDLALGTQRQRFSPSAFGGTNPPTVFSLYNASVKVSYGIDLFGGLRRMIEAQGAQVDYERYQLEGARLALTANVVTAAISEASLREQIRATQEIVDASERQLAIAEKQYALGGIPKSALLLQRNQVAQARAALPPLEQNLERVRSQLAVYVGKTPSEAKLPEISLDDLHLPDTLPVSLPSKLARQRPDILAAEALLHAASAQVGVATANLYPQITLTASAGTQSISSSTLFANNTDIWNFAAGVTQPIFHAGSLRAQKRAAVDAYDKALADYRSTLLQSFQNVSDSLTALQADARTLKARSESEASSKEALSLAQRQFELGASSYLTLLAAQTQYQQDRIASIAARASRYADSAALLQSLGGGWWNQPKNGEVSDD